MLGTGLSNAIKLDIWWFEIASKIRYLIIRICIENLYFIISDLSQACPFGTFGIDCMYRCHCLDSADCDDTSGRCTTGCAGGWDGPSCQRGIDHFSLYLTHFSPNSHSSETGPAKSFNRLLITIMLF